MIPAREYRSQGYMDKARGEQGAEGQAYYTTGSALLRPDSLGRIATQRENISVSLKKR